VDALIGGAVALAAVALTAWLTRSHERRTWARNQTVEACTEFLTASSAVEQWGAPKWAARLKSGQHPTDYKLDVQRLEAAMARLRLVAPSATSKVAYEAVDALTEFLDISTDGADPIELLPRMAPMMSSQGAIEYDKREVARQARRATRRHDADSARKDWRDRRERFITQAIGALRKE
jgi:hypothetical protein